MFRIVPRASCVFSAEKEGFNFIRTSSNKFWGPRDRNQRDRITVLGNNCFEELELCESRSYNYSYSRCASAFRYREGGGRNELDTLRHVQIRASQRGQKTIIDSNSTLSVDYFTDSPQAEATATGFFLWDDDRKSSKSYENAIETIDTTENHFLRWFFFCFWDCEGPPRLLDSRAHKVSIRHWISINEFEACLEFKRKLLRKLTRLSISRY